MKDSLLPLFSRREVGDSRRHILCPSEVVVSRLNLYRELHPQNTGLMNWFTNIQFNDTGDRIFTSHGGRFIDFRNWERDTIETRLDSEIEAILDFKILPSDSSNDMQFIISGLNGEVRHGTVTNDGHMVTRLLGHHVFAATNLAVQCPNVFFSIGIDGEVIEHDLRTGESTTLFRSSQEATVAMSLQEAPFQQSFYPLMAVHPLHPQYFCVGGFNDTVHLYDVRMNRRHDPLIDNDLTMCVASYTPPVTPPYERPVSYPNILDKCVRSLAYSNIGELLVSYSGGGGDQLICLFRGDPGFGIHLDVVPPPQLVVTAAASYTDHRGTSTMRGATFFGHDDQYILCGSTCGNFYIWKKHSGRLVFSQAGDSEHVTVVQPFSQEYRIATFGIDGFIRIWAPVADEVALSTPDNSHTLRGWIESPIRRAKELAKDKARARLQSMIETSEGDLDFLPRRPRGRLVVPDSDDDEEVVRARSPRLDDEESMMDMSDGDLDFLPRRPRGRLVVLDSDGDLDFLPRRPRGRLVVPDSDDDEEVVRARSPRLDGEESMMDTLEGDLDFLPRRPRGRLVVPDSDDDKEVVRARSPRLDDEEEVDGDTWWGEIAGNYWVEDYDSQD